MIDSAGKPGPLPLALALLAALRLAARRRMPLGTLAVAASIVLVAVHIDARTGLIAVLAPAVALFSLAMTRGRAQQVVGAAVAVALVLLADMVHGGNPGPVKTLGHVALVAVPMLAADALRTRRSYVALLLERMALAEQTREHEAERRVEQERLRIARELHDIVAHTLTTINVQASTAAQLFDDDPAYARAALSTIEDASRDATAELRVVLGVLRDRDDPAASRTPAPGLGDVADLVERACSAELAATLETSGRPPERLLDTVSLAAYRIVQESLTNVHRHAAGAPVRVQVCFTPTSLRLAVENGSGAVGAADEKGVGIAGMTERAAALGGTLHARQLPGGFRVDAVLPYELAP